jgi:uncharacterized oxidoreductase
MPTVQAKLLQSVITDIFQARGVPADDAQIVAAHLVDAEACGVVSHGIIRMPQYVQALADGRIAPSAELRTLTETPATVVLDGQHGFGQVMALRAMDLAVDRAIHTGVSAVTLVQCSHTGRLGSYTERAARRGLAALMMVNAGGHGQWVAPFGGSAGRLSTNPISIAVPTGTETPLVLDIATSVAPEGKIRALLGSGERAPEGWLIDAEGRPTTDPGALYGPPRGALLPFGGHKGFGLAIVIDALAGGLSGAGCCAGEAPLTGQTDGILMVVLNVAAFGPPERLAAQVEQLIHHVKACPTLPGFVEVLVPGEVEFRTRERRLREGIPVDNASWRQLQRIARDLGSASGEGA